MQQLNLAIPEIAPKGATETDPSGPELFDAFKDSQGRYRTQSLFYETRHASYPAYFTTKRYNLTKNGKVYHSLYLKYMEIADPTEYQVAVKLFGSWDHWQALCKAKWFIELITGWREELKIRLESERFHEMKDMLEKAPNTPQALQATKWLADRYGEKATATRGRPTKAEKATHLKRLAESTAELDEDAERIGLT